MHIEVHVRDVDAFFFFVDADFIMNIYGISAHPILTADYQYVLYLPFLFYPFPFNISTTEGASEGPDNMSKKLASLSNSVGSLRTSRESSVGSNSSSSSIQLPKREKGNEIRLTMREADDERFLKYSNDRKEGGADPKRFSVNLEWIK